jgi:cardiolipin synthase
VRSLFKGGANLRDHRKLIVADAALGTRRLWCGGRNMAAEYFTGKPGTPPWKDLSFDLSGELVIQASALFEHDWNYANGRPNSPGTQTSVDSPPLQDAAQLIASGPDQDDDTIYSVLVTAAYRARSRIVLATPYFVPDAALLTALCLAARRGVAVDLLLPERSNHRLSDLARARALRSMVQAGAKVWLVPGMLHAKLVAIDETLALAGSANVDSRSLFLNFELMVAFHDADDVRRFVAWFDQERHASHPYIARQPSLLRDIAEGTLLWLAFQL